MTAIRKITLLAVATLLFLALCGMVSAATYEINDWNDFNTYMYNPTYTSNSGSIFELKSDIYFPSGSYQPIGNATTPFKGTFNGNNYTLYDFSINANSQSELGLFGKTDGAKIYDLNLRNFSITASGNSDRVGLLAGNTTNTIIENCSASGSVQGRQIIGGLVGDVFDNTTITRCYTENITVTGIPGGNLSGGLVGNLRIGTLYQCFARDLTVNSSGAAGGLVGGSPYFSPGAVISECFVENGTVRGTPAGGLAGYQLEGSRIENCYSMVDVETYGSAGTGGLVGLGYGYVLNSYAAGNVTYNGATPTNYSGLVGATVGSTSVSNSFFRSGSNVSGSYTNNTGNRTETQLKNMSTFSGWSITNSDPNSPSHIWYIDETNDYPKFTWASSTPSGPWRDIDLADSDGSLTDSNWSSFYQYHSVNNTLFILRAPPAGESYRIYQSSESHSVKEIVISDNVVTEITIDGITLDGVMVLNNGADLTLLLDGINKITGHISVATGRSITIDSATVSGSSQGTLSVNGTRVSWAGIGGDWGNRSAGNITINGGTVDVIGITNGAGIGGGLSGNGGIIRINNGTVNAISGYGGAGIGGGNGGNSGDIMINGSSTVTAVGSNTSAGIGGGAGASGETITINNGTINATGGRGGAGIGGGGNASGAAGNGGTITINNGNVTATGGSTVGAAGVNHSGAGIGGGSSLYGTGGDGGTITINNGTVIASGGLAADNIGAGIGGAGGGLNNANPGAPATISISRNATVIAYSGGSYFPAIHAAGNNLGDGFYVNAELDVTPPGTADTRLAIHSNGASTPSRNLTLPNGYTNFAYVITGATAVQNDNIFAYNGSNFLGDVLQRGGTNDNSPLIPSTNTAAPLPVKIVTPSPFSDIDLANSDGSLTNTYWTSYYEYSAGVLTIKQDAPAGESYRIWQNNSHGPTLVSEIVVNDNITTTITIISITIPGNITLNDGTDLTLLLSGSNTVSSGIRAPSGTTLAIDSAAGIGSTSGSLFIQPFPATDANIAGIGGNATLSGGDITIRGGTLDVYGGNATTAIGGGYMGFNGTITISGGRVNATGGANAAGIGGDDALNFHGSTIMINGNAEVNATGDSAGIGGKASGPSGNIIIGGNSVVTARGTFYGTGIGGGGTTNNGGSVDTIWIGDNATVTAIGTGTGSGIGGGGQWPPIDSSHPYVGGNGGNITITGTSNVTAIGGSGGDGGLNLGGAGIGAGRGYAGAGLPANLTINNAATVKAYSSGDLPAIDADSTGNKGNGYYVNAKLDKVYLTTAMDLKVHNVAADVTHGPTGSPIDSLTLPASYKNFAYTTPTSRNDNVWAYNASDSSLVGVVLQNTPLVPATDNSSIIPSTNGYMPLPVKIKDLVFPDIDLSGEDGTLNDTFWKDYYEYNGATKVLTIKKDPLPTPYYRIWQNTTHGPSLPTEIVVNGITTTIVIDDITITGNIILDNGAKVALLLDGTNTIVKGIRAPAGRELTIDSNNSTPANPYNTSGMLIITAPIELDAGIGGGNGSVPMIGANGGTIKINGGTLNVIGGRYGAGIGGGCFGISTVEINGGIVNATGGEGSAGIGGGYLSASGSGGTITITNGTVNATGGMYGAGIGGGLDGSGGNVHIFGGTVTAIGRNGAAGVGAGEDGPNGAQINISTAATIYAYSMGILPAIHANGPNAGTGTFVNAQFDQVYLSADNMTLNVFASGTSSPIIKTLTLPANYRNFAFMTGVTTTPDYNIRALNESNSSSVGSGYVLRVADNSPVINSTVSNVALPVKIGAPEFTISGTVTFNGTTAPLSDVEIVYDIDGVASGSSPSVPKVFTNSTGEYEINANAGQFVNITNVVLYGYMLNTTATPLPSSPITSDSVENFIMIYNSSELYTVIGTVTLAGTSTALENVSIAYTVNGTAQTPVTTSASGGYTISANADTTVVITGVTKYGYLLNTTATPLPSPFAMTTDYTGIDFTMIATIITIHVEYYINGTHDPTLDTNISAGADMVYVADVPVPSGYSIQSTSPALPVKMNNSDILSVYLVVRTGGSGFGNATIVQDDDTPPEPQPEPIDDRIGQGISPEPEPVTPPKAVISYWALLLLFLLAIILFVYRRVYGDRAFNENDPWQRR